MEQNWLERTELLLGEEKVSQLKSKNVLVVGLGGVGAYATEMICRAGVGKLTIVDGDIVNLTNINRQLPALNSTISRPKTEVMAERLKDINPELKLTIINEFIKDEFIKELVEEDFDYVVDAIDTLSPKVYLIYRSLQRGLNIVSSMGAGGKMDPSKIEIAKLEKSYNCNLARVIRKRLRKLDVEGKFPVVFSSELVNPEAVEKEESQNKKSNVGTISYMPALFGMFCASKVIRDLSA